MLIFFSYALVLLSSVVLKQKLLICRFWGEAGVGITYNETNKYSFFPKTFNNRLPFYFNVWVALLKSLILLIQQRV